MCPALETFYILNNSFRSILVIAACKEFIENGNPIIDVIRLTKLMVSLDLTIMMRSLLFLVLIIYPKFCDKAALLTMRS
jgi:hypothetical protein